eukprot:NODE_168_length_16247_cov_0.199591.p9 type:complete len:104 gc:universal NODE_168_length_16247_cov_0.199591:7570-7259(-)
MVLNQRLRRKAVFTSQIICHLNLEQHKPLWDFFCTYNCDLHNKSLLCLVLPIPHTFFFAIILFHVIANILPNSICYYRGSMIFRFAVFMDDYMVNGLIPEICR